MPGVYELNNFHFPSRAFLLRKYGTLSLTAVIFIVRVYGIFHFNLSLTFSVLPIDLILQGQNNNLLKVQMLSILLLVNCFS